MRRTFNDLARRAGVDAVVTRSITGHVTEQMREHYSSVDLDEKRAAITNVVRLVPRTTEEKGGGKGGGRELQCLTAKLDPLALRQFAGVTQLVEYLLPKQAVAGSSPVARSSI